MEVSGNTVLITGGTSGIGLEFAAQLLRLGNAVIVTGRDQARLDLTREKLPAVHTFRSDVSDPDEIEALFDAVIGEFPRLNFLINNAGVMCRVDLRDPRTGLHGITTEIDTNLSGTVRMVKQFLPHLRRQESAAIMNVSSGLAFVPLPISPVYCATKAALHSFTQSLRVQLRGTNVTVFELAPPITETALFNTDFGANPIRGAKPMAVQELVNRAIEGIAKDRVEIRPGLSNVLWLMSRIAPGFMLERLSKSVANLLADANGDAIREPAGNPGKAS
jgi:uncharacterized oxidoreductase